MNRGQAPDEVAHVDKGGVNGADGKDHIHFENQKPTLNSDGTWDIYQKVKLPKKVKKWLEKNGWTVPK